MDNSTTATSIAEVEPTQGLTSQEVVDTIVEFVSKGYTDEDVLHILPDVSHSQLDAIKKEHAPLILRTIRDYYLVTKHSDDLMDELESDLLEKLRTVLALEMDPMKLVKIFQTLNSAKRRSKGEGQVAASATIINETKTVNLIMPTRMVSSAPLNFETNKHNEVIKVGETIMTTATNTQVLEQLKSHKANILEQAQQEILDQI